MKNCIFMTIIIILGAITVGLLIGLIIVAMKKDKNKDSNRGSPESDAETKSDKAVAKTSHVEEKQKILVEWNLINEVHNVVVTIYYQWRLYSSKTIKEDNQKVGSNANEVD